MFNLGHGITPDADPENVTLMIETLREEDSPAERAGLDRGDGVEGQAGERGGRRDNRLRRD